jgi:hypothetical protein
VESVRNHLSANATYRDLAVLWSYLLDKRLSHWERALHVQRIQLHAYFSRPAASRRCRAHNVFRGLPILIDGPGTGILRSIACKPRRPGEDRAWERRNSSYDALRLKQNSTNPSTVKDTVTILETAQKTGLKISEDVIREEGTKFVHAGEKNPEAWQAVSAFLNYRSYLNVNFTPPIGQTTPVAQSGYLIQIAPKIGQNRTGIVRHEGQIFAAAGNAPPDKAALLETLQTFNVARSGPALLIVEVQENDAMVLDGAYIRNVIIRNTPVRYSGGPLVLDNVYFVNCSFEFVPETNTRQLADVILTSAATTFKTGA